MSDYDPDHRGVWGASSVVYQDSAETIAETARDLLEQAQDAAAQDIDTEPKTLQAVVYTNGSGDIQTWVGPASDWTAHAAQYSITPDDIADQIAFVGYCIPSESLTFPEE
jgi:hypothetical protein